MGTRTWRSTAGAFLVAGALIIAGVAMVPGISGAAKATGRVKPPPVYYLSLGDSYSQGYQTPTDDNGPGFTDKVAKKAHMTLENFGCGGATTTSLTSTIGCSGSQEVTHEVLYPTTTQEQAALNFIAANPAEIGLITVSIGGNDVTACATNPSPITCVLAASTTIKANVDQLVASLNTALTTYGDTAAKLVGLTYPDVILGSDVYPVGDTNPILAGQSVTAFDTFINPTLDSAYTSVPYGSFVNVTTAPYVKGAIDATAGDDTGSWNFTTGVYTGATTKLKGFGKTVPESVAEVCTLTYYCSITGDIHPNTKGYSFITSQILADLDL
ncbi:MAG: GDSL-type esterase/lipase family protein [Acidimicrobiales bacterium]|jgi:lysophospholipase L1-like esterase